MPEAEAFLFSSVSDSAARQVINRNVAGAQLSGRLWRLNQQNQRNINRVVTETIRNGRSVTSAAKELLKIGPENVFQRTPAGREILTRTGKPEGPALLNVRIPKYVRELKDAADKARAISDNSIMQQTVRKYQTYINNLTRAGEPEYQHLGIRGASRMLVKRLQSENEDVYKSAVDKWVARKASYQARVVARNETNEAHWAALQAEGLDKPYVTAYRWNFGSHPEPDICDDIRNADLFGLGPGVYRKGQVPNRPHPNCNCWLSQILDENYFANYTPPRELLRQVRDDPRFPEFKAWATGWLTRYATAPEIIVPIALELGSLAISELRDMADEIGIRNARKMSKAELISAIKRVRGE